MKSIFFVCFCLLVLLLHPFYTEQSVYKWLYESLWQNKTAQVEVHSLDSDSFQISEDVVGIKVSYPDRCKKGGKNHCAVLELPISQNWQTYQLAFQIHEKGKYKIRLRGPDKWEKYGLMPIFVDYKKLFIDQQELKMPEQSVSHECFSETPVYNFEDGQKVTFSCSLRQHHLSFEDIKFLFVKYKNWKISSPWKLIETLLVIFLSLLLIYHRQYRWVFCLIVFVFLTIPPLYISSDNVSKKENRSLYKFPELFPKGNINESFGLEFNNWFGDRFGGRNALIDLRYSFLYRLNNKISGEYAFMGDENWLFPKEGTAWMPKLEVQHQKNINLANHIKKIAKAMKDKNIEVYLIIEPYRSLLYKQYWEKYYPASVHIDHITELKEELKDFHNIHLVDLKSAFEKNKNEIQLYEKDDVHMTLGGGNIMLDEIIKQFGHEFEQNFKERISSKDRDCALYSFLHYYSSLLKIPPYEATNKCKEVVISNPQVKSVELEPGIREGYVDSAYFNKELFILFPCYEEFLFPVLSDFFSHTISVNYNVFKDHNHEQLKRDAIAKMKALQEGAVIIAFLSDPTGYEISRSTEIFEEF